MYINKKGDCEIMTTKDLVFLNPQTSSYLLHFHLSLHILPESKITKNGIVTKFAV